MIKNSLGRRKFIQLSTIAVSTSFSILSCGRPQSSWRFFTETEAQFVGAIADQIIPPDQDPGGRWAGVVDFIDRQLVSYFKAHQQRYRRGLETLEKTSLALKGKGFLDLSSDDQIEFLEALETDRVPEGLWSDEPASGFFNLVLDHCMKGFYGTPRHGGNRDFVSYRMIGLDYPQILGRVKS